MLQNRPIKIIVTRPTNSKFIIMTRTGSSAKKKIIPLDKCIVGKTVIRSNNNDDSTVASMSNTRHARTNGNTDNESRRT